ncbi:hypothetical protein EPO44_10355, partial [bacterium]
MLFGSCNWTVEPWPFPGNPERVKVFIPELNQTIPFISMTNAQGYLTALCGALNQLSAPAALATPQPTPGVARVLQPAMLPARKCPGGQFW